MAVGAYASAMFTQKFGLPFAVSVPLAGADRRRGRRRRRFSGAAHQGHLLLLLTLGFWRDHPVIALSWEYVGGAQGYRNIPFNPRTLEYVVGIIVVLIFFFGRLERSSLGRAMDSIHQDETAAEVMGIDVVRIKLFAFGLGAGDRGRRRRALCASGDLHGLDHLQHHAVGGNPDVRGGRRRQHLLGTAGRRGRAVAAAANSCARCANGWSCCRWRGRISIP